MLHLDYLFPADPATRDTTRELYNLVKDSSIYSPHGHCDPKWFATNNNFSNPYGTLVEPDHYLIRMLLSQGVSIDDLIYNEQNSISYEEFCQKAWRIFVKNYHLYLGTPSLLWLEHALHEVLQLPDELTNETANQSYDFLSKQLIKPEYSPRNLFKEFKVRFLATTDFACDSLQYHQQLASDDWDGRIVPTFRPDDVTDPSKPGFIENVRTLGELSNENIENWQGFLKALAVRREQFIKLGAVATDHGVDDATTLDLSKKDAALLYEKAIANKVDANECKQLRAQLMTEMARMSIDDGLVMQLHAGPIRNHHTSMFESHGKDIGFDIPKQTEYAHALRPLLNRFGMEKKLTLVLYTIDETTYGRELAPLAGVYPSLRLGAPWWFYDSPEGMIRFREQTTETAGLFNLAGFVDDTRAFFSIPARHDMARRIDARMLATWVAEHRISQVAATTLIEELAVGRVCDTFNLER